MKLRIAPEQLPPERAHDAVEDRNRPLARVESAQEVGGAREPGNADRGGGAGLWCYRVRCGGHHGHRRCGGPGG